MLRRLTLVLILLLTVSVVGVTVQGPIFAQENPPEATAEILVEPPTETPTDAPVPTDPPTESPTSIPTEIPTTAEATETVTDSPTVKATPTTVEATEEAIATATPSPTLQATPEPLPTEPPLSLLVGDAFDGGSLANWIVGEGWTLAASNGGQALQTSYSAAPVTSVYANFFDAAFQADLMIASGAVELRLRESMIGSYRAVLSVDGQVSLYRADALVQTVSTTPMTPGEWRTLRLSATGGALRVAVNGVEVITFLDLAPLPPGTAAFAAHTPGAVTWVDNVQIWVPSEFLSSFVTPTPNSEPVSVPLDEPAQTFEETLPSGAKRFTVDTESDEIEIDGFCGLREAMISANGGTTECGTGTSIPGTPDEIYFNITDPSFGQAPYTFLPFACVLPDITSPVHINGYSQPGATKATAVTTAILQLELVGANAAGDCDGAGPIPNNTTPEGLVVAPGGSGSIIEGLSITRFPGSAIEIRGATSVTVRGMFIGLDVRGIVDFPGTSSDGIKIIPQPFVAANATLGTPQVLPSSATNNIIGGTTPADRNLISGNASDGIELGPSITHSSTIYTATLNTILGNFIGVDITGTVDFGNGAAGVFINGVAENTVGGTTAVSPGSACSGACNVISGNNTNGVEIKGTTADENIVIGNLIGLNASGSARLPNTKTGVVIAGGGFNFIGGTTAAERNVITGNNDYGIELKPDGFMRPGNRIVGNYIGTNIAGTATVTTGGITGNAKGGVFITGAFQFRIGGTEAGARNIISGNQGAVAAVDVYGIVVTSNSSDGEIWGNFIGTNAAGTGSVPNRTGGILITGSPVNTEIGGTTVDKRNVISGNLGVGIELRGVLVTGARIRGNFIGTDASGTGDVGNGTDGVRINGAVNNFIGGPSASEFNVIAGNAGDGVEIVSILTNPQQVASGNSVQNNRIGVNNSDGALRNDGNGVRIADNAFRNQIGADPSLETDTSGNLIANNGLAGVRAENSAGYGNSIMKNVLRDNGSLATPTEGLGIDLGAAGVTPNDAGDVDDGPNRLQNFPALVRVDRNLPSAGRLQIQGRLTTTPNPSGVLRYRIDFFANSTCDGSNHGEGQVYLGSLLDQQTDSEGVLDFIADFPDPNDPNLNWITFTATEKLPVGTGLFEWSTSEFSRCVDRNNNPPTISDIGDQTTEFNTPVVNIPFTVGDVETSLSLTVQATSSNAAIVPNATGSPGFVIGGTGTNRTLTINPDDDLTDFGTVLITVTVTDLQGASASDSFNLTVEPPNQPPTINPINSISTGVGQPTNPITITVNDPDGNTGAIALSATSSNTTLVPNIPASFTFGGAGGTRSLVVQPTPGQSGTTIITVTATDEDNGTAQRTFSLFVGENTAPTFTAPVTGSRTINMNVLSSTIAFTVADAQSAPASLVMTATSSNQTLIPDSAIQLGPTPPTSGSRTVRFDPVDGEYGVTVITLTVTDAGGLSATDQFTLSANRNLPTPANQIPTLSNSFTNRTIPLNTSTPVISFTLTDNDTDSPLLEMLYLSNNPALVPNNSDTAVAFGGSGLSRNVVITPLANQTGAATLDIIVHDGQGGIATRSFVLTVTPNNAPTITNIADQVTNVNTATPNIAFTVNDDTVLAKDLLVTAASSNTTLVPNANIIIGPATPTSGSRTIQLTPASNQLGSTTITVTVTEPGGGGLSSSDTFILSVRDPANTGNPTVSAISDRTITVNTNTGPIAFTVADTNAGQTAPQNIQVTATSSNQTLVPNANIIIGPASPTNGNRTIQVNPAIDQIGSTMISVIANDTRGRLSAAETFTVTVELPPNAPPTISVINNQFTRPNTIKGPINFVIGDSEPLSGLIVGAASDNQTVLPNSGITLGGSGVSRTITLTPAADQLGEANITVSVTDSGALTTQRVFKLTVANNLPPVIEEMPDETTPPNVPVGPILVVVSDDETPPEDLIFNVEASNETLIPDGSLSIGGTGAERSLSIAPIACPTVLCQVTITVTVTDGDNASTDEQFLLTIAPTPPNPLTPANYGSVPTVRPTFTWTPIRGLTQYQIQVDDNSDFSSPIIAVTAAGGRYIMTTTDPALVQKTHYWRVRGLDSGGNPVTHWSAAPQFNVNLLKLPVNSAFTVDTTPTLSWFPVPGAVYNVVVDDSAAFSSPLPNVCGANLTVTTCTPATALPAGLYYWRVDVTIGSTLATSSVYRQFTITPSFPAQTRLASPTYGSVLRHGSPTFDWNVVTGTDITYQIQIDNVANFSSPEIIASGLTDTQYDLPSPPAPLMDGRYYWRVRAFNTLGAPGPWSAVFLLTVDAVLMKTPANNSLTTDQTPTFIWTSGGAGANYIVEVDDDPLFGSPLPNFCPSPLTTLTCTPAADIAYGVYYWRVRLNGIAAPPLAFRFTISPPPPGTPLLLNPLSGSLLNDNTPTLSWAAVAGTGVTYELQVDNDGRFGSPDFTTTSLNTTFGTVTTALPDGRYSWRVRAISALNVPGAWSAVRVFTIDTVAPAAPVLTLPVANTITGDTTPTFKWRAVAGVRRYWIQIATNPDFTVSSLVISSSSVFSAVYTVPGAQALNGNVYYWRVRAIDAAGNIGPASPAWTFTINAP